jgi:hypothetical protein
MTCTHSSVSQLSVNNCVPPLVARVRMINCVRASGTSSFVARARARPCVSTRVQIDKAWVEHGWLLLMHGNWTKRVSRPGPFGVHLMMSMCGCAERPIGRPHRTPQLGYKSERYSTHSVCACTSGVLEYIFNFICSPHRRL